MASRPYFQSSITELEDLAERNAWTRSVLAQMDHELSFRFTRRARHLSSFVSRQIRVLDRCAAPGSVSAKRPRLDRRKIVEINDIVVLDSGRRLMVHTANVNPAADTIPFRPYDALAKHLLQAALGDEITVLNGQSAVIVDILKHIRDALLLGPAWRLPQRVEASRHSASRG